MVWFPTTLPSLFDGSSMSSYLVVTVLVRPFTSEVSVLDANSLADVV